jgi:hypothetical protein
MRCIKFMTCSLFQCFRASGKPNFATTARNVKEIQS